MFFSHVQYLATSLDISVSSSDTLRVTGLSYLIGMVLEMIHVIAQITLRWFCDEVRNFVADRNHESPWHKSCHRLSWFVFTTKFADFVANISTCQDGLCLQLLWFASSVHDFSRGKVSVNVGVMEFGLMHAMLNPYVVMVVLVVDQQVWLQVGWLLSGYYLGGCANRQGQLNFSSLSIG